MEPIDKVAKLGTRILMVGLILQAISYLFFVMLVVYSFTKYKKNAQFSKFDFPWILFHLLFFSSACILVSSYSLLSISKAD